MVFSARPLRTLDNKLKLKLNKSGRVACPRWPNRSRSPSVELRQSQRGQATLPDLFNLNVLICPLATQFIDLGILRAYHYAHSESITGPETTTLDQAFRAVANFSKDFPLPSSSRGGFSQSFSR